MQNCIIDYGSRCWTTWKPLLDYTNGKFHVNDSLTDIEHAEILDPQEIKEIANVLWDNVDIIDNYLAERGNCLSEEEREIVSSWKRCEKGRFIIERHLKSGTILISVENGHVYRVCGIISSWEEMFYNWPLPIMINTALIPFKDVIISDGLQMVYSIKMGGNMKRSFKDTYMESKKNGSLIQSL